MPRKRIRFTIAILVIIAAVVVGVRFLTPAGILTGVGQQPATAAAQQDSGVAAGCQPDRPAFYYGFADLRANLGNIMGSPVECEHSIHVNGDTSQRTTTGYAYYRKSDNVPTFTNGWDHWALTTGGLVHWSGYVVDPPTAFHMAVLGA